MLATRELPTREEIISYIKTGQYGKFDDSEQCARFKEMFHAPQSRTLGELYKSLSPEKKIEKLSRKNKQKPKCTEEEQKKEANEMCALGQLGRVFSPTCTPGPEMLTGGDLWKLRTAAEKYGVPFELIVFPNINLREDEAVYAQWQKTNAKLLKQSKDNGQLKYLDDLEQDAKWREIKTKYFEDSHDLDKVVEADIASYLEKHPEANREICKKHIIDSAVSFLRFHSKIPGQTNVMIYPKELTDTMVFLRALAIADGLVNEAGLLHVRYDTAQNQLAKFAKQEKPAKPVKEEKAEKAEKVDVDVVPDEEIVQVDPKDVAAFSKTLFAYVLKMSPDKFIEFACAYTKVTDPKCADTVLFALLQQLSLAKLAECAATADQMSRSSTPPLPTTSIAPAKPSKSTSLEYAYQAGLYSPRRGNVTRSESAPPSRLQRALSEPSLPVRTRSISPTHG